MHFKVSLLITITMLISCHTLHHPASKILHKKLDSMERNALCCRHKLRCCHPEDLQYPNFEVKTIIMDCPTPSQCNPSTTKRLIHHHGHNVSKKLTNCKKQLSLTIRVTNSGPPNPNSQYVIIDQITEPTTGAKVRILNPYAIRIRQDPLLQVYGLEFESLVNGEAKEKVLNRATRDYKGCNTGEDNPSCGAVRHEGAIVPYSTGFCCSCDGEALPDVGYKNEALGWKRYGTKHYGLYDHAEDADKHINYHQTLNDGGRRVRRGGQTCDEPLPVEYPESLRESTHCLTFSHLWFSTYKILKPTLIHRLHIQVFQKYEDPHGETHWMDLTTGHTIHLGSDHPQCFEPEIGIAAHYTVPPCEEDSHHDIICAATHKLLVPEKVVDPENFMVVPTKLISPGGKKCNSAGVGYEAFYKQQRRCSKPPGSCLSNQPEELARKDESDENEGKNGSYFLKFHGTLACEDPVEYNSKGQMKSIRLVYNQRHVSVLSLEMKADLVTLMKPNAFAIITEAYIDGTNAKRTRLVIKVTNSGLLYGVYYVRLGDCPMEVPTTFNNIASKSVLIAPQQQHIFNLYIEYALPIKDFFCVVFVHNVNQELIASRQIRIRSRDRCFCLWYCECVCYVADRGLKCNPININAYHLAGYQGGLPVPTQLIESSYLDEMLALAFHMLVILTVTLLLMGLVKAVLGLALHYVSIWGLDTILGTDSNDVICDNKDCEYRDDGMSIAGQFCLNLIFFFVFPLALLNLAIKKMCFPKYTNENESSGDSCNCTDQWAVRDYECDDTSCPSKKKPSSQTSDEQSDISLKYTSSEDKETQ